MKLPKRWVVERELKRIQLQISQIPWFVWSPISRALHDRKKKRRITVRLGGQPRCQHVAVLLIFQPNKILDSLLHTMNHLTAQGYAVLLVANHPLSGDSFDRVAPHCWKIMQRPNYGYDYGGYRDAILHLLDDKTDIESLLVLNDSVWFPVSDNCTLLDQFKAADQDVFGFVLSEYRHRSDPVIHLQSYMFAVRRRALEHPAFEQYWRKLPISSNKHMVVRRCEKRMTQDLHKAGFSYGAVHKFADVTNAVAKLSDADLLTVARYQIEIGSSHLGKLRKLLADKDDNPEWRNDVRDYLDVNEIGKYIPSTHPIVLVDKLRSPLLKKDRSFKYQVQRRELLSSDLRKAISPALIEEIEHWDR